MTQTIASVIDIIGSLYAESGVAAPTAQRPIAPLAELLESHNLIHTEVSSLSSRSAMDFLLRQGGMVEPLDEMDREPLAGYFYAIGNVAAVFVEQSDIIVRRRFSAAHEFGHYIRHYLPLRALGQTEIMTDSFLPAGEEIEPDELPEGCITFPRLSEDAPVLRMSTQQAQMEQEANQFAAELLMPVDVVQALTEQYRSLIQRDDLVWRMATDLLVSRAAMRWRLRNLDILRAM
jgi:hypothetical protein